MELSEKKSQKLDQMIEEGFLKFPTMKEVLFWQSHGSSEVYPRKNNIFYQKHMPVGVFILVSGVVSISYLSARKYHEILVKEPVMIGLNHVMEITPYKYSVETYEPSQMIFLEKSFFTKGQADRFLAWK